MYWPLPGLSITVICLVGVYTVGSPGIVGGAINSMGGASSWRRWINFFGNYHGPASQPVHHWIRELEWARSDGKASTLAMISYVRNGFVRGRHYLLFSPYDLILYWL